MSISSVELKEFPPLLRSIRPLTLCIPAVLPRRCENRSRFQTVFPPSRLHPRKGQLHSSRLSRERHPVFHLSRFAISSRGLAENIVEPREHKLDQHHAERPRHLTAAGRLRAHAAGGNLPKLIVYIKREYIFMSCIITYFLIGC